LSGSKFGGVVIAAERNATEVKRRGKASVEALRSGAVSLGMERDLGKRKTT